MKEVKKIEKFIEMRAGNCTLDQISKELNENFDTLVKWERENGYVISNKRVVLQEAINEKYYLSSHKKLELYGDVLLKLLGAIDNRDFSDVPTEKLLDFLPKYHSILKEYSSQPNYMLQEDIEQEKKERNMTDEERLREFINLGKKRNEIDTNL